MALAWGWVELLKGIIPLTALGPGASPRHQYGSQRVQLGVQPELPLRSAITHRYQPVASSSETSPSGVLPILEHVFVSQAIISPGPSELAHRGPGRLVPRIQSLPGRRRRVTIEDDCWIGWGASSAWALRRKGALIGANAVVTETCSLTTIHGGVPSRPVGNDWSSPRV